MKTHKKSLQATSPNAPKKIFHFQNGDQHSYFTTLSALHLVHKEKIGVSLSLLQKHDFDASAYSLGNQKVIRKGYLMNTALINSQ